MKKMYITAIPIIFIIMFLQVTSNESKFDCQDYSFVVLGSKGVSTDGIICGNEDMVEEDVYNIPTININNTDRLKEVIAWFYECEDLSKYNDEHSDFVNKLMEDYNEEYFKENALGVVLIEGSHGGNIYGVKNVECKDDIVNINMIKYSKSIVVACYIEYTIGIVEINKNEFNNEFILNARCESSGEYPPAEVEARNGSIW